MYDSAKDNRDADAEGEREVVGGRAVVRRAGAVDTIVDGTRGKDVVEMAESAVVGSGRVDVAVRVKWRVDAKDDVMEVIGEVALGKPVLEVTRLLSELVGTITPGEAVGIVTTVAKVDVPMG